MIPRREPPGQRPGSELPVAIFYHQADEQKRIAEDTIADVDCFRLWPGKVVTEVAPAGPFLGGRARASGLSGEISRRVYLSLHSAELDAPHRAEKIESGASEVSFSMTKSPDLLVRFHRHLCKATVGDSCWRGPSEPGAIWPRFINRCKTIG